MCSIFSSEEERRRKSLGTRMLHDTGSAYFDINICRLGKCYVNFSHLGFIFVSMRSINAYIHCYRYIAIVLIHCYRAIHCYRVVCGLNTPVASALDTCLRSANRQPKIKPKWRFYSTFYVYNRLFR